MKNENTFVTRVEDSEYLVVTSEDSFIEAAKSKFENVEVFNVVSETGETISKMITFNSKLPNAYHVRQALGIVESSSNHSEPKDEIDAIAKGLKVQRNTLIAIAMNAAKQNSITKVKKQLGNDFDNTILKVNELIK